MNILNWVKTQSYISKGNHSVVFISVYLLNIVVNTLSSYLCGVLRHYSPACVL